MNSYPSGDKYADADAEVSIEQLLQEEAARLGILPGENADEADSLDDPEQLAAEASTSFQEGEADSSDSILDDLLNESMYAYQASVKMRKGQKLTTTERSVLQYQEVERNWEALGLVGLVSEESCTCGASHSVFVGWYGIMQHRGDPTAKRICRVTSIIEPISYLAVPQVQHTLHKAVSVCGACLAMDAATPEQVLAWGLGTLK